MCSCRAEAKTQGWGALGLPQGGREVKFPVSKEVHGTLGTEPGWTGGQVCSDFLETKRSKGVRTVISAVLVEPAGSSVLAIPEPGCLKILSVLQVTFSCTAFICPHCKPGGTWRARVDFGKEVHVLLGAPRLFSPVVLAYFISLGSPNYRLRKMIVFAFLHSRAAKMAEGVHEMSVTAYDCKHSANT